MESQPSPKYAFRCRNCGRLHEAAHAGVNQLPHACIVCSSGVAFTTAGVRQVVPDCWEVLAEATSEHLEELGLTTEQVEAHTPVHPEDDLQADLERIKTNHAVLTAKKAAWEAEYRDHVAAHDSHAREVENLDTQLSTASYFDLDRLETERHKHVTAMKDLEGKEFTGRDEATLLHLKGRIKEHEATLASGHFGSQQPKSVFAHAVDGSKTTDKT